MAVQFSKIFEQSSARTPKRELLRRFDQYRTCTVLKLLYMLNGIHFNVDVKNPSRLEFATKCSMTKP